jgi:hypothetical protein
MPNKVATERRKAFNFECQCSGTNFLPIFGEQDHNDQQNEGPTDAIYHFIGCPAGLIATYGYGKSSLTESYLCEGVRFQSTLS